MKLRVPTLESVCYVTENVPKMCKKLFDIELDFSIEGIESLEGLIDSFPRGDESTIPENLNEPLVAIG
jgi:hypothetical protein